VIEIVGFMRWLGWGCLAAVLALVGNAIVLSVQDRIREHAIFRRWASGHQIARLIISEGLVLSVSGALIGCAAQSLSGVQRDLALSVESHSISGGASPMIFVWGGNAAAVGVLAGLVPAWQASRRDIVSCFPGGVGGTRDEAIAV
jgi:cell division protein FtsX